MSDPARQRLVEALARVPQLRFAYLFGSRASGRQGSESDWDLAVYCAERDARLRWELRERIGCELDAAIPTRSQDLTFLEEAPSVLAYQVIRSGVLLFSRDEDSRIEFVVRTLAFYFDEQPLRRIHEAALLERMTKGKGAWSTGRSS
ncbi:MAG: nucleotidyltransferase domain-containing protein [Candidatus Wallbacteria bacterium]|nr:nucleotidyltransferase domain-containing protein [Candidatus Wallbacteria bacterium]